MQIVQLTYNDNMIYYVYEDMYINFYTYTALQDYYPQDCSFINTQSTSGKNLELNNVRPCRQINATCQFSFATMKIYYVFLDHQILLQNIANKIC